MADTPLELSDRSLKNLLYEAFCHLVVCTGLVISPRYCCDWPVLQILFPTESMQEKAAVGILSWDNVAHRMI